GAKRKDGAPERAGIGWPSFKVSEGGSRAMESASRLLRMRFKGTTPLPSDQGSMHATVAWGIPDMVGTCQANMGYVGQYPDANNVTEINV
ncbi:hypothetical protein SERLADRAFT_390656, partial [Serpula lacrymans var. lacrymans S7.9]